MIAAAPLPRRSPRTPLVKASTLRLNKGFLPIRKNNRKMTRIYHNFAKRTSIYPILLEYTMHRFVIVSHLIFYADIQVDLCQLT